MFTLEERNELRRYIAETMLSLEGLSPKGVETFKAKAYSILKKRKDFDEKKFNKHMQSKRVQRLIQHPDVTDDQISAILGNLD